MLLDDVAVYLVANSTAFSMGGTTGTLAKAIMTEAQPDTISVLYEQAGSGSEYAFSTGTSVDVVYEQASLQVLSRSTSYQGARNAAQAAYTALDGLGTTTLSTASGVRYLDIEAVQAPFTIGRDDQERYLVSCNYTVRKEVG